MPDTECVEYYQAFSTNDGSEWARVDHRKENVLHVAARRRNSESVKWLMEKSGRGEELALARNISGYTPLETLQDLLETARTQTDLMGMRINISDEFCGFPSVALSCLSSLLRLDIQSMTSTQLLRLKYGCTCGNCLGGFISPHMKSLLAQQAELIYDELCDTLQDASERDFDIHRYAARYVKPDIQRAFQRDESIWEGYVDLFSAVASCLGTSNVVPTSKNIFSELPRDANLKYIELNGTREGKVEPVLQVLTDEAKAGSSMAGNGDYDDVFGESNEC